VELSFILNAARRRWWLVALCALLGAIPGFMAQRNHTVEYQATSVVAIAPPRAANQQNPTIEGGYIDSQVEILGSGALLQDVADALDLSFDEVQDAVAIDRRPGTDVVDVRATNLDPATAQAIANTLASEYLAGEDDGLNEVIQQRIDDKNDALDDARALNETATQDLADNVADWIRRNPTGVPVPDAIDPVSFGQITQSQADIDRLQGEISDLENSLVVANSTLIEQAALPVTAVADRSQLILIGGAIAGGMLGLVLASIWAMSSTVVLDPRGIEEVLTAPVVGEIPRMRALAANQALALERLPKSIVPVVDQLCIRAEALGRVDEPLTVVVVGARRHVGTSTIAMAMANRYAAVHSAVVLVDADARDRTISQLLDGGRGGIPQLIRGARWDEPGTRRRLLTPTNQEEVRVLGFGNDTEIKLQRTAIRQILATAQPEAQVVVVDAGAAMGSAAAIQLCQMADAVVLATPLKKLDANLLDDIAAQISRDRAHVLPVITPTLGRFRQRKPKVEAKPIGELTQTAGSGTTNGHHPESELKPVDH
jgi:capsular polysaccharide biosynthesis protein